MELPELPPSPPSLVGQLRAAVRARIAAWRARVPVQSPRREWQVAAAVAGLLALGPVATILGANLIADSARAESRRLAAKAAPRVAADHAAERERTELAKVVRRPGIGAVIESVARALPPEASLVRAERNGEGLIELEISTLDPDKVRAALRREPLLASLRDSGQRQADAALVVSFRESVQ